MTLLSIEQICFGLPFPSKNKLHMDFIVVHFHSFADLVSVSRVTKATQPVSSNHHKFFAYVSDIPSLKLKVFFHCCFALFFVFLSPQMSFLMGSTIWQMPGNCIIKTEYADHHLTLAPYTAAG